MLAVVVFASNKWRKDIGAKETGLYVLSFIPIFNSIAAIFFICAIIFDIKIWIKRQIVYLLVKRKFKKMLKDHERESLLK